MMTSAEIKFEKVIAHGFQETLKPLRYIRRGNNFYSQINGVGHIINIQKGIYSSRDQIEFTINAGIFYPEFWLPRNNGFNKPGLAYPREPECILKMRIGDLRDEDDIWYDVHRNTNEKELIREMKMNVKEFILPLFGRALSKDMLVDLMDQETFWVEPLEKLVVCMALRERERAKKAYKELTEGMTNDPDTLERIKALGRKYGLV